MQKLKHYQVGIKGWGVMGYWNVKAKNEEEAKHKAKRACRKEFGNISMPVVESVMHKKE